MKTYNVPTPSIEEIKAIGFIDVSDKYNFPRVNQLFELEIPECSDSLFLRISYQNGWYWSVRDWDKNEPRNCQPIHKVNKIKQLIAILKGA